MRPSQFYALMLAPPMSDWSIYPKSSSFATEGLGETEMRLRVFADAALAGIQTEQARRNSRRARAKLAPKPVSSPEKKQPDLLGSME